MTTQSNVKTDCYAPRGLQTDKPVAVRYFAQERTEVEQAAQEDGRSVSSYVRIASLIGMEVLKKRRAAEISAAS